MWRLHKCFQYFTRKWIKDYLYHSCYFGLILYLSTLHTCSCYSQLPQLQHSGISHMLPWFSHHWGSLRPTRYHLRHHLALAYLRYLPQHPVNTVTPTISPRGWIKPLISAVPVTDWTNDPGDAIKPRGSPNMFWHIADDSVDMKKPGRKHDSNFELLIVCVHLQIMTLWNRKRCVCNWGIPPIQMAVECGKSMDNSLELEIPWPSTAEGPKGLHHVGTFVEVGEASADALPEITRTFHHGTL